MRHAPTDTATVTEQELLRHLHAPHKIQGVDETEVNLRQSYDIPTLYPAALGRAETQHCLKSVTYKGSSYAALDLVQNPDTDSRYSSHCQSYYLPLPAGWSIAPDDQDSIRVISSFPWGTSVMHVQGSSYWANSLSWGNYGQRYCNWCLDASGTSFRVNSCNLRILLKFNTGFCWRREQVILMALIRHLLLFPDGS
jgi:hypothetical protein